MNEIAELSTDIHIITAEINAYQRVAGEAIFEIGRRLKHVKENDLAHGEWSKWCEDNVGIQRQTATRMIQAYEQFPNGTTSYQLPTAKIFEMLSLPAEIDRQQFVEKAHIVPSTQETKTVDEMTVRELREVKKALKEAEAKAQQAEVARRDAEIKARQLARATEPIIKEIEVERIVEVDKTDYRAKQRLEAYEAKFGALENYSERHRATNIEDITTAARSFNLKVRELIKQHAYLLNYPETIIALDARTRSEFDESIRSLASFANDLQGDVSRSADIFEAEYVNVQ